MLTRVWTRVASLITIAMAASACFEADAIDDHVSVEESAVIQTCTGRNIAGYPYQGTVCGGSVSGNCSAGQIYSCKGGSRLTTNNCTLLQSCAVGCLTGPNSTPQTANTASPTASWPRIFANRSER